VTSVSRDAVTPLGPTNAGSVVTGSASHLPPNLPATWHAPGDGVARPTCRSATSTALFGGQKSVGPVPRRRFEETGVMLLIDAANVVGSRPTGWWRDRPGAARAFVERVRAAAESDRFAEPVVVVLEGVARSGVEEGIADGVTVLHAPHSGDDKLIAVATDATSQVTLVSADRELRQRAEALGAKVASPGWLIDLLDG